MARESENDPRPLSALGGSIQVTSGALLAEICHKLVIVFTVAGNLTVRTLDGTSTTLATMPVGPFTLDAQFDTVTWTGTATATAFYRI